MASLLNTATDGVGRFCLHVAAGCGSCECLRWVFFSFLFFFFSFVVCALFIVGKKGGRGVRI